jgi:hypothetical protein
VGGKDTGSLRVEIEVDGKRAFTTALSDNNHVVYGLLGFEMNQVMQAGQIRGCGNSVKWSSRKALRVSEIFGECHK